MKLIEIYINELGKEINILIDIKNNKLIINNKVKLITKEKVDELLRIIRLWKNEYKSTRYIDSESFLIKINYSNDIEVIKGQGEYPENYQNFKDWVGDFYE